MADDTSKRETEPWKVKYNEQKELLKQKDKEWRDSDNTLRRGISRLTFAIGGIDPKLDKLLSGLRDAIRENHATDAIVELINDIASLVKRLDDRNTAASNSEPGHELALKILQGLTFPDVQRKRAKKLAQRFETSKDDIEVLHGELTQLLQLCFTSAAGSPAPGGWFERLTSTFSRGPQPETPTTSNSPEPSANTAAETLGITKRLLIDLIRHIQVREEDVYTVKSLTTRLERAADETDFDTIITEFSEVVNVAQVVRHAPASAEPGAVNVNLPSIQDVLIQFVDELAIPSEFVSESSRIKDCLANNAAVADFTAAFKSIVDLVVNMRKTLVQEKQELEDFLRQLTQRLQEMDQHLGGTQTHQQSWAEQGRKLEAAVQTQVREIKSTVHEASDLQHLKITISERLDVLQTHLGEYQRNEEQRQVQLASELTQVKSRLDNVEHEADSLRTRLKDKHQQTIIDPLTGAYNRLAYEERITQEVARWKRYNTPLTLMVLDVDHFKHINDHYGHKAGDKALKLIADALKHSLRETDFLTRYGGEEFVALVTDTPADKIEGVAEKLRAAIEACKFHYAGKDVPITISCGYATFRDNDSGETAFNRADAALYRAKERGRNQCCNADTATS